MGYEITSGKIQKAQKVVIYGPEGVGKSSLAACFPSPLFIDTEGSTHNLDVNRYPRPSSWAMLIDEVRQIIRECPCKALVIDTIDWGEMLCVEHICNVHGKKGIEDFGYGNGYVYEKEEFGKFLNLLEEVVAVGINVVLTAHAQMRKFSQPDEIGEYDRWELKLGKKTGSQISPLIKEWADLLLFANYKTIVSAVDKDGKKFKAQGNSRVMYTVHHACWDAKNRHGLPDELPLGYDAIAHIFDKNTAINAPSFADVPPIQSSAPAPEQVQYTAPEPPPYEPVPNPEQPPIDDLTFTALADLMNGAGITESEIQSAVAQRGYYPKDTPISAYDVAFVDGVLVGAWDKVYEMVMQSRTLSGQ